MSQLTNVLQKAADPAFTVVFNSKTNTVVATKVQGLWNQAVAFGSWLFSTQKELDQRVVDIKIAALKPSIERVEKAYQEAEEAIQGLQKALTEPNLDDFLKAVSNARQKMDALDKASMAARRTWDSLAQADKRGFDDDPVLRAFAERLDTCQGAGRVRLSEVYQQTVWCRQAPILDTFLRLSQKAHAGQTLTVAERKQLINHGLAQLRFAFATGQHLQPGGAERVRELAKLLHANLLIVLGVSVLNSLAHLQSGRNEELIQEIKSLEELAEWLTERKNAISGNENGAEAESNILEEMLKLVVEAVATARDGAERIASQRKETAELAAKSTGAAALHLGTVLDQVKESSQKEYQRAEEKLKSERQGMIDARVKLISEIDVPKESSAAKMQADFIAKFQSHKLDDVMRESMIKIGYKAKFVSLDEYEKAYDKYCETHAGNKEKLDEAKVLRAAFRGAFRIREQSQRGLVGQAYLKAKRRAELMSGLTIADFHDGNKRMEEALKGPGGKKLQQAYHAYRTAEAAQRQAEAASRATDSTGQNLGGQAVLSNG